MGELMQVRSGKALLAAEQTGAGTALVLLHAGVTDRRSWSALVGALADRWRVIAYDRRGYGDTMYEPEPYSDLDDLVRVLDATDVEQAVLIGSSMGGLVALEAALDSPERVHGLVLVAPAVSGAPYLKQDPPEVLALAEAIEAADADGDLDTVNRLEAHYWLDGPLAEEGRVGGPVRNLFLDMNGRALRAAAPGDALEREPVWPRLDDIAVPTVVVACEMDEPSGTAAAVAAAGRIPEAQLIELPGVAHLPQLEQPELLLGAMTPHLDAVRAGIAG